MTDTDPPTTDRGDEWTTLSGIALSVHVDVAAWVAENASTDDIDRREGLRMAIELGTAALQSLGTLSALAATDPTTEQIARHHVRVLQIRDAATALLRRFG